MKREQSKKIFTRMLINNWGGIDHQVIQFHEHVNLFSGKAVRGNLLLWMLCRWCCTEVSAMIS